MGLSWLKVRDIDGNLLGDRSSLVGLNDVTDSVVGWIMKLCSITPSIYAHKEEWEKWQQIPNSKQQPQQIAFQATGEAFILLDEQEQTLSKKIIRKKYEEKKIENKIKNEARKWIS